MKNTLLLVFLVLGIAIGGYLHNENSLDEIRACSDYAKKLYADDKDDTTRSFYTNHFKDGKCYLWVYESDTFAITETLTDVYDHKQIADSVLTESGSSYDIDSEDSTTTAEKYGKFVDDKLDQ